MLAEPAQSLTDLLLGIVVILLALGLRRTPAAHGYWRVAFWWTGAAALAGAVYHAVVVEWARWAEPSWAVISLMVVVAVSYLLAATVVEVLGPGRGRVFWLLRSVGIIAYAIAAAAGHPGIAALMACESLTMTCVVVLWVRAAIRRHPRARPVLIAFAISGFAGVIHALSPEVTDRLVGLDPISAFHLVQIVGMWALYLAVGGPRRVGDGLRPARQAVESEQSG